MTGTHEAAGQSLLQAVEAAGQEPTIIVLVGLSGSGKSTVVDEYRERLKESGGNAISYETAVRTKDLDDQPIVTTATPSELARLQRERVPGRLVTVTLQGMTAEEAKVHIERQRPDEATLPVEELVAYSLGIPTLADLLVRCNPNAEQAARLSAAYLRENLQGSWVETLEQSRAYLQIEPNEAVVEALKAQPQDFFAWFQSFQNDMIHIVEEWERRIRKGDVQESPLVIADSEQIFIEMLAGQRYPRVVILASALQPQDFDDLQRLLGYRGFNYDTNDAPRMELFGASYRKAGVLSVSPEGDRQGFLIEQGPLDDEFAALAEAIENGIFPLPRVGTEGTGAIMLSKREHHGLCRDLVRFCWAVESWLQQRGVPYLNVSYHYGWMYYYLPETQRIEKVRPVR